VYRQLGAARPVRGGRARDDDDDVDAADALVASIDREFDYDDLCTALWALDRDIPFIGTDPDVVVIPRLPSATCRVPGP